MNTSKEKVLEEYKSNLSTFINLLSFDNPTPEENIKLTDLSEKLNLGIQETRTIIAQIDNEFQNDY